MPNDILNFLSSINETTLIVTLITIYIVFYLLIALLTSSMLKPLLYLGDTTLCAGIFILLIRLASNFITTLLEGEFSSLILMTLPSILKPILTIGIFFTVLGIAMIIVYKIYSKQKIEIQKEVF